MLDKKEPLAYRMCPKTIEEFAGQKDIIGNGRMLYRMIKADRISSIILYGPPGTGKTSLARIIAATTAANFENVQISKYFVVKALKNLKMKNEKKN